MLYILAVPETDLEHDVDGLQDDRSALYTADLLADTRGVNG